MDAHVIAAIAEQTLHALANDRRTQMADMHALGDVRPTVVDDDAALVQGAVRTAAL